jgi:EmrB/QacA subfamily drug resistance transporter
MPRGIPNAAILALMAVAEFMLTLDLSIVNVALPAIRGDLGFSQASLQWVVNGYALTFAGFLLLGGRAADLFGGRRVFLGALGAFSLASLACALATAEGALVAARVVQGLSAGVLSPVTLSILTATYREPEARNRALSIWTAVAIGGGAIGGLLGGVLTSALSWRWIFLVNVPVGAVLLALAASRLPRTPTDATRRELDLAGAITVTGGLTALVWGLIRSEESGWGSADAMGGFALAAALLGAFAVVESRVARSPLVPFAVFRSRLLSAGNLLSFLSFVPVIATWYFMTLYLQAVRGFSPMETGLLFLPMALAVVGGSQLSFRLLSGLDARALFAGGGLVAAAGLAWLGRLGADTGVTWVIVPASIAMVGGGLMFAPIMVAATSGVAPDQGGLASGLVNTTRQIGGALGLAALGTIAAAHAGGEAGAAQAEVLSTGYAAALDIGAAIYMVTAIVGTIALPVRLDAPTPRSDRRPHRDPELALRGAEPHRGSERRCVAEVRVTQR